MMVLDDGQAEAENQSSFFEPPKVVIVGIFV